MDTVYPFSHHNLEVVLQLHHVGHRFRMKPWSSPKKWKIVQHNSSEDLPKSNSGNIWFPKCWLYTFLLVWNKTSYHSSWITMTWPSSKLVDIFVTTKRLHRCPGEKDPTPGFDVAHSFAQQGGDTSASHVLHHKSPQRLGEIMGKSKCLSKTCIDMYRLHV